ncbi:MAG: FtsX-like permease family protein [Candidatus Bathyarchaeia archaeon]
MLCILGVALSTMMLIGIGTTITRCTNLVEEMSSLFKGKILVVARGVFVIQAFPIGGAIPENILEEISQIQGVKNITPLFFQLNFRESEDALLPSNVTIGMPSDSWHVLVGNIPLKAGRWPQNDTAEEIVVGLSLADQYGLSVGSKVDIKNHIMEVVGVLDIRIAILSQAVIMPLRTAQKIYKFDGLVSMIVVEPDETINGDVLSRDIENEITGVKALTEEERNDFIRPLLNELKNWNFGVTVALLTLTMCLVATITFMSISERKREFAILGAIGAPKSITLRMVVIETMTIGLFGSLMGLVLGIIAALFIVSRYTSIPVQLFMPNVIDLLPLSLALETITLTTTFSCLGGIISSLIANRELTIEILRGEH